MSSTSTPVVEYKGSITYLADDLAPRGEAAKAPVKVPRKVR